MSKDNICKKCKNPVGNPVFTICDDCWEIDDNIIRAKEAHKSELIEKLEKEKEQSSRDVGTNFPSEEYHKGRLTAFNEAIKIIKES